MPVACKPGRQRATQTSLGVHRQSMTSVWTSESFCSCRLFVFDKKGRPCASLPCAAREAPDPPSKTHQRMTYAYPRPHGLDSGARWPRRRGRTGTSCAGIRERTPRARGHAAQGPSCEAANKTCQRATTYRHAAAATAAPSDCAHRRRLSRRLPSVGDCPGPGSLRWILWSASVFERSM